MQADTQEKVFKRWFDDYKNLLFKVVRTYAQSQPDRDDLFQEILLQLWNSIPSFQGNSAETTWIYRVALNTALVWNRTETRKRKRHRISIDFEEDYAVENTTKTVNNNHVLERLYENIRKLPKIDSSLIFMHLEGLSYDTIADVLGISKNYVGVRLNRAKKQLADLMKGIIDEF